VDTTNPHSNTACTEEAGILQCSGDSMNFDSSLKQLLRTVSGGTDCITFRKTTKENHKFALEYCARLLRFTVAHHGPVRDHHIQPELRRDAMAELLRFLQDEIGVAPLGEVIVAGRKAKARSKPKAKSKAKSKAESKARAKSKAKAKSKASKAKAGRRKT